MKDWFFDRVSAPKKPDWYMQSVMNEMAGKRGSPPKQIPMRSAESAARRVAECSLDFILGSVPNGADPMVEWFFVLFLAVPRSWTLRHGLLLTSLLNSGTTRAGNGLPTNCSTTGGTVGLSK